MSLLLSSFLRFKGCKWTPALTGRNYKEHGAMAQINLGQVTVFLAPTHKPSSHKGLCQVLAFKLLYCSWDLEKVMAWCLQELGTPPSRMTH